MEKTQISSTVRRSHNQAQNAADMISIAVDELYGCELICCTKQTPRRPIRCMRVVNNAKGALAFLCLALFLEGLINAGLFNAVISTIEKRFQFQSTESGLIASGFDIFTCMALLVLAFSGDRAFKPMWLGWGTFIMGFGCVLYSLPHFTAPEHNFEEDNPTLCGMNQSTHKCEGLSIRNYMYLFLFANGLIGLGSTPLFTVAITYIDENVKQKNSALYGGIYYSMGAIGPAVGYVVGSALVTVYTNIGQKVDIPTTSSLWIGAWWIGFLIVGIACMILSFFIIMLPRNLPGTSRFRRNRNTEVHRNRSSVKATKNEAFGKSWKDAPKVVWLLATNVPYVSLTLSSCINYSFVYGFNTFGAKYISSVFGISTSEAALAFGIAGIFGAAGGQFLGGLAVTKLKLTVTGILKLMIICTAFSLATSFGFLLHCRNREFNGPQVGEVETPSSSSCYSNCTCDSDVFKPICGADGTSYFSACFAGCRVQVNETYFTDCSCIAELGRNSSNYYGSGSEQDVFDPGATVGECVANNCNLLIPFIIVIFASMLAVIMKTTPNLQATIRCIPFNLRTTAVSLQRLVFTLLGTIPGRILTGKVLDLACISWGTECGIVGACRAYDTYRASIYMTVLLISQMAICLILQIVTLLIYKRPKNEDEGSEEGDNPIPTEDFDLEDIDARSRTKSESGSRKIQTTPFRDRTVPTSS